MHQLLRRQLAKHCPGLVLDPELTALLAAVDAAYREADLDRAQLERSLDLTSSELIARNEQMRATLDALPDMIFVASAAHEVLESHASNIERFGATADLVGATLSQVFPTAAATTLARAIDDALAGDESRPYEYTIHVDGEQRQLEARAARCDADVVVVVRDRTEEARLHERLRLADRMASIGTLAAGIAHEINNPLAYVLANLELAGEAIAEGDAPELPAILADAVTGAKRVTAIVRDLKVFCHPSPRRDGRADLRRVLESSLRMAANEIRHRARLVLELGELPPTVGDEARLGQVFLNLLSNAAQAIPVGDADNNEIRVSGRRQGARVVIDIADTGCGIPAGMESVIFDPFVTTKPVGVGTGLGLSICRKLVGALGGEIVAARRMPRGAVFSVALPIAEDPTLPAVECERPRGNGMRYRVLIVDDEPRVAAALATGLRMHDVEAVTDARVALTRLLEADPYDVVLCDVMMPQSTGVEIYEEVARARPALASAFVFVSGGVFTRREEQFLQSLPNPRLDKPCDLGELRRTVERHGAWQRARRERAAG
ncbi:MAG TPA: ATP-binding protein [Nannocystaceae bacterium]|nr:ATP-binding protein [Nannocystaceae bacterium]